MDCQLLYYKGPAVIGETCSSVPLPTGKKLNKSEISVNGRGPPGSQGGRQVGDQSWVKFSAFDRARSKVVFVIRICAVIRR